MTILYHGTTAASIESILSSGLIPRGRPGLDSAWRGAGKWHSPDRDASVFVTPSLDVAEFFARLVAVCRREEPSVVELMLPDGTELLIDEAGNEVGDRDYLRHIGRIPPECIQHVYPVTLTGRDFVTALLTLL
jgi:hypothetical protein